MLSKQAELSEQRGFPAEFTIFEKQLPENEGHNLSYSAASQLFNDQVSIEVCLALKLLEEHASVFEVDFKTHKIALSEKFQRSVGLKVIAPTKLGVEFLSACNPQTVSNEGQSGKPSKRKSRVD
jgi:hypothetical protein